MNIKPVFCRYVELLAVWTAVLTLSVMAVLLVVSVAAYSCRWLELLAVVVLHLLDFI